MSYDLEDLDPRQPLGTFTNSNPLVAEFTLTTAESRNFVIALTVSAVSGAGPTYATAVVETTWDDGDTWVPVSNVDTEAITSASTFLVYATSVMSPVSPRCRVTWTPVAAHTITVSDLRKARHAPGDAIGSTPPSTTAGAGSTAIASPLGESTKAASVSVALPSNQAIRGYDTENTTYREAAVGSDGGFKTKVADLTTDTVRNDYSSVNVTTGAWVELIASTATAINLADIFDSSGQVLELGIGAAASEVRKIYIMPGGNGRVPLDIPAGSRVAIRAVDGNATVGQLVINFYKP